jgi:hypothetical protein
MRLIHVLAQRVEETLFGIQYALAEITAQHHQGLQIGDIFDVFRDRHAAETVGKIDSGLTDRGW